MAVTGRTRNRETALYLPSASAGQIRVSGRAVLESVEPASGGGRIAFVAPRGVGDYSVTVAGA